MSDHNQRGKKLKKSGGQTFDEGNFDQSNHELFNDSDDKKHENTKHVNEIDMSSGSD